MYDLLLGQNIATVIYLGVLLAYLYLTRVHAYATHTHRTGVETLWNMLSEMNVKPDAELVALVSYWVFMLR